MALALELGIPTGQLEKQLEEARRDFAASARAGVVKAAESGKDRIRAQVRPVLGDRVAKSIRGGRDTVFPRRRSSRTLTPAATIYIRWRKGEEVLQNFLTGATIRAGGGRYLAIPTENVPRTPRGRGGGRRFTVAEVEQRFGELIWLKSKTPGVFVGAVRASRTKAGRVRALRRDSSAARRRRAPLVAMFTFISAVTLPRRLNFDQIARKAQASVPELVAAEWRRRSGNR